MTRTYPTIIAAIALTSCLGAPDAALAWHGHHWHHGYLTIRRSPGVVLPGYHCALGRFWRPSLHVCQGGPYVGGEQAYAAPVRAEPTAPMSPTDALPPPLSSTSGRHTTSTDTRIVDRHRQTTRDGVLVTYEVRTRVTERYRKGDASR